MKFNVTFETISPESAEHGDVEESGFYAENCKLRDAVEYLGYPADGLEADCYPAGGARWITAYDVNNGTREYYESGTVENRSLHFPDSMTDSSKMRLMRLLGVYGVTA